MRIFPAFRSGPALFGRLALAAVVVVVRQQREVAAAAAQLHEQLHGHLCRLKAVARRGHRHGQVANHLQTKKTSKSKSATICPYTGRTRSFIRAGSSMHGHMSVVIKARGLVRHQDGKPRVANSPQW